MLRTGTKCFGVLLAALSLAACPAPKGGKGGGGGGGGGGGINPGACGAIDGTDVGRKLNAFLIASAELDAASIELEGSVKGACVKMAQELQIATDGDTATVCDRVVQELKASMELNVKSETKLVTKYTPAVCTIDVGFAATVAAECEVNASANVTVTCEGHCGGTCSGACDGTCSGATGEGGQCNGQCSGTCKGSCSADCHGTADVRASAECKASAEIRASVKATCTEPKVEVVYENVTVVDDAKFQRAKRAIEVGLPTILQVGAKAKVLWDAFGHWASTAGTLVKSSGSLIKAIGNKGLCVAGQLGAALSAVAQVQVRVEVSVSVSANVSGSAGGAQ